MMIKELNCKEHYNKVIGEKHMVETKDFLINQASNGHITITRKEPRQLFMHVSCMCMYTGQELQEYAGNIQRYNEMQSTVLPTGR